MNFNWIKRAAELEKDGVSFAIATVINTIAPTSAKSMAKAIILSDGTIEGWIGGGCSIKEVTDEALSCITSGKSKILRLSPEKLSDGEFSYKKEILLTCESGGTLEFHIEPILPMTKLLIYGNTPTAIAIARMGALLGYNCFICSPKASIDYDLSSNINLIKKYKVFSGDSIAIVATQGEGDLIALKSAIASKPKFLSMIISRKKASSLLKQLKNSGFSKVQLSHIKFPAGLDIGAKTPEEIAVSVVAELIKNKAVADSKEQVIIDLNEEHKQKDLICGMLVNPGKATDTHEYNGKVYYFCCSGCKDKFELQPSLYL
tara:strand:+ start:8770 stop:9720 length:951 start_codon:yes stop_codon:yes gene_type:complete